MSREVHVRFCEGLGVRFPRATRLVILFKEKSQAEALFLEATQAADELKLTLNSAKTALLDLRDDFRFLGFDFTCTENWASVPAGGVTPLDQMGWRDASEAPPNSVVPRALPGETGERLTTPRSLALLGPEGAWLDVRGGILRRRQQQAAEPENLVPMDRVDHLFVVGFPTLHRDLLRHLARTDKPLLLASDNGIDEIWLTSRAIEHPEVVRQQIALRDDMARRLQFSRKLVVAKIDNYAATAVAYLEETGQELAVKLQSFSKSAGNCESIEQLLGFEGAAAAAWYGSFSQHRLGRFEFPGRFAPLAQDPLNILLNIGFTALYNWTSQFLRVHGFTPALGIFHEYRANHASLASDLMEPFRHLVDATVIDCAPQFSWRDFEQDAKGPFPTRISHRALKRFRAAFWSRLQTFHLPVGREAAVPYLKSLEHQVISLRRHLLDRNAPFVSFRQIAEEVPT